MIDARVNPHGLAVTITGGDAFLFATRRRWQTVVPLEHVVRASTAGPLGFAVRRHASGNSGHIVCARRGAPVLVIDLDGSPYLRMTAIKGALRLHGR